MNKEELQWLKEISTTTGISYSGDQTITTAFANKIINYIEQLEQENNQLKEQYCERTDCGGRLGNSKKVERLENTIKELRSWLEEMLDNEKDIFSVVRVKDVLSKLNELEGGKND